MYVSAPATPLIALVPRGPSTQQLSCIDGIGRGHAFLLQKQHAFSLCKKKQSKNIKKPAGGYDNLTRQFPKTSKNHAGWILVGSYAGIRRAHHCTSCHMRGLDGLVVGTISLHILHMEQHGATGSSPRPVSWAMLTASVWKSAR